MYREIEGDLLKLFSKGEFDVIGHGANCFSTMGAGIAAQIKEKHPDAYYADIYSNLTPEQKLGNYTSNDRCDILNIYSQYNPGKNLDYEALSLALRKINDEFDGLSIGLPQIGCGIAGGDWEKVREIIKSELKSCDVTVVIYKK